MKATIQAWWYQKHCTKLAEMVEKKNTGKKNNKVPHNEKNKPQRIQEKSDQTKWEHKTVNIMKQTNKKLSVI